MSKKKKSGEDKVLPNSSDLEQLRERVYQRIIPFFNQLYPEAVGALNVNQPWTVLVATVLSAQCTDKRVNEVLPELFQKYPDNNALALADQEELEAIIKPCGLFHSKAANLIAAANIIKTQLSGIVPDNIDQLVTLPGVGRKTANCVLVNGYNLPGIMCDTHCIRVSSRLGLHEFSDPDKIEIALKNLLYPENWSLFSHQIILFGREICQSRKPKCDKCQLQDICEFYQTQLLGE